MAILLPKTNIYLDTVTERNVLMTYDNDRRLNYITLSQSPYKGIEGIIDRWLYLEASSTLARGGVFADSYNDSSKRLYLDGGAVTRRKNYGGRLILSVSYYVKNNLV